MGSTFLHFIRDFDEMIEKQVVLAGSPQSVRQQVKSAVDETGINYFSAVFQFGNLTHQQAMRSMDLFVREVMPAFR